MINRNQETELTRRCENIDERVALRELISPNGSTEKISPSEEDSNNERLREEYTKASDAFSEDIANDVIEYLGLGPESPYVTHHDAKRAATVAARLAIEYMIQAFTPEQGEQQ